MSAQQFAITRNPHAKSAAEVAEILANPGFGKVFTDHLVRIRWTLEDGWAQPEVLPYGPIELDPSASVLHYGQEIFEGMKAYRHADGSVWTFRPFANAARFNRSANRLALPEIPQELFVESIRQLVQIDAAWVPDSTTSEASLYLRPFMFASEAFLGVRAAHQVDYYVIASPAGAYFSGGVKPVSIWITEQYTRAAEGGTGQAKCGGNYAASLIAQTEAAEQGCAQVCFLDACEGRYIEELGGMNVYVIDKDGNIHTPELGTILEGVTRASILQLAQDAGRTVTERKIAKDELIAGLADGTFTEIFACGTAAVVTPIGELKDAKGTYTVGNGEAGEVTTQIRGQLLDVQSGRANDTHNWLHNLV